MKMPISKKAVLLSLAVVTAQMQSYHKIGIQPFCNVSPSDRQISCNYESASACLAYMENGQKCVTNEDYIGDLPPGNLKTLSTYSSPEMRRLLQLKQQL